MYQTSRQPKHKMNTGSISSFFRGKKYIYKMMKFQISFNSFLFFGLTPSILIFIKYFFRLSWLFFVGCQTPSTELFFYMGTRRRRAVQTGRPHCHRVRVYISFVSLSFSCIYSFFFFYYSSPSILPLLFFFFFRV